MTHHRRRTREELLEEVSALEREVSLLRRQSFTRPLIHSFFPAILRNIPNMIFAKRADDLSFSYLNRAGERLLGVSQKDIIGKTDYDFFPRAEADFFTEKDREVLKSGIPREIPEEPITTAQGVRWLSTKKIPLMDSNGEPLFLVGISEDITERKMAEDELRAVKDELEQRVLLRTAELEGEKERLSLTLQSIAEGVVVTNRCNQIVLTNPAVERMTGWSAPEIYAANIRLLLRLFDKCAERLLENDELVSLSALSLNDGLLCERKDGSFFPIHLTASPIFHESKNFNGHVIVFRDITHELDREQQLLRSQKLESVGQLAGGIAHDFNNLLAAILGNVSLAHLEASRREIHSINDCLETAEAACLRAKSLTEQLLTFSKGGKPVKKVVSVLSLLDEAKKLALGGSNVLCELLDCRPELLVLVDSGQIAQVLNNLLINAKQAMPNGGTIKIESNKVLIPAGFTLPLKPGEYVKIVITDKGCGISEEHLGRVFDPYFTTKKEGSGLGLATSYSIVSQHGGFIDIDSTIGEGTSVTLYLPSTEGTAMKENAQQQSLPISGRGHVLIMDDDAMVQDTAVRMIESLGYQVAYAWDGSEAIAKYKHALQVGTPFDAVILDLTIRGGTGGEETARQILKLTPDAKLIVSSGYSNNPVASTFSKYGFRAALAKPYDLKTLSQVLADTVVENKSSNHSPTRSRALTSAISPRKHETSHVDLISSEKLPTTQNSTALLEQNLGKNLRAQKCPSDLGPPNG